MATSKIETPNLDLLRVTRYERAQIDTFIIWLNEHGMAIYEEERREPISITVEQLLAQFFEIDLAKAEEERQALLKELQDEHDK